MRLLERFTSSKCPFCCQIHSEYSICYLCRFTLFQILHISFASVTSDLLTPISHLRSDHFPHLNPPICRSGCQEDISNCLLDIQVHFGGIFLVQLHVIPALSGQAFHPVLRAIDHYSLPKQLALPSPTYCRCAKPPFYHLSGHNFSTFHSLSSTRQRLRAFYYKFTTISVAGIWKFRCNSIILWWWWGPRLIYPSLLYERDGMHYNGGSRGTYRVASLDWEIRKSSASCKYINTTREECMNPHEWVPFIEDTDTDRGCFALGTEEWAGQ